MSDWVRPEPGWHSYITVWEWPPYSRETIHRNVWISYAGDGKIWIDQVEMFLWDPTSRP